MLFIGGIQLLCLAIIGSYVAHIYEESKHRPPYRRGEHHQRAGRDACGRTTPVAGRDTLTWSRTRLHLRENRPNRRK